MGQEGILLIDCCVDSEFILDLSESNDKHGLVTFRAKLQEAEVVNKNKRMYPFDVLNENVKRLQDLIKDRRLIGECDHPCVQDPNFEVLTPSGWKKFKEMRAGDSVYSRRDGKMVESTVLDIIDEPYDGKTIHVKGNSIDCTFTAPHKFLLTERSDSRTKANQELYVTIDDIHNNRIKYSHNSIPKTASWEGRNEQTIKINGVLRPKVKAADQDLIIDTEKFVIFLGLYLAEGCLGRGHCSNRVEISQKTEYGREAVRKLLADFHPDIVWKECNRGFYTSDARLHDYLVPLGNKYTKYIPKEIKGLDKQYLTKLVAAFALGDGRMLKSENNGKNCYNIKESLTELSLDYGAFSRISVFSVSEQLIDDLHECIVKCGYAASKLVTITEKDYLFAGRIIKASNKKPLHSLNISRSSSIHLDPRFLKTIENHHTGRIYCLSTEHGNFYMRYKGKSFWTGNCDSIVHFANASHLLTRLYWDGNILMGEGQVLNTPYGKLLKALIQDGVKIGMSSRGVGNGKVNENGILVIGESYKLITFDAVADPSTFGAFHEKVVTKTRNEDYIPKRRNSEVKNEGSSIDMVSKEALIACLGGIVSSQVEKYKARLK